MANQAEDKLPTKEEWEEWMIHPVTKLHRELLVKWVEGLREQWSDGNFLNDEISNAGAQGEARVLVKVLETKYEEVIEAFTDD